MREQGKEDYRPEKKAVNLDWHRTDLFTLTATTSLRYIVHV